MDAPLAVKIIKMAAFQYNYAIVCRIPNSFHDNSIRSKESSDAIDITRAREEHRNLIETLKVCGVNIIEMESDENYPDCAFVEDCAVIIGQNALITRPGHKERQGEVAEIRRLLKKDLGLVVVDIENPNATLDGGDVLFTGKEIIVAVTPRTNMDGAQAVAGAFPDYSTTYVKLDGPRKLKYYVSMAGRDIIASGNSDASRKILATVQKKALYKYYNLELEDKAASNILYVNGRLIHRTRNEIKESYIKFDEKIGYTRHDLELRELSKGNGHLSNAILFVSKYRYQKDIISTLEDYDLSPFQYWKNEN